MFRDVSLATGYLAFSVLFFTGTRLYIFTSTDVLARVDIWQIFGAQISYVFIIAISYYMIKKSHFKAVNLALSIIAIIISILFVPYLGFMILFLMFLVKLLGNKRSGAKLTQ
ncbi:hypothetical protein [Pseudoalteromonas luteoviolacea]|uniref:Uncharacterized protein n=1 Tax=Pseudoalteromonas luteoviolacea S4054 TaxID=1129367 RepID=A0A0F6A4S1_9GAMM|nr:hypothetical protein [Pseudoalteromonas luteoviolacea]AOT07557.1 hypothetical protein S4054249_06750 [Pseudoalteromonas luteoviolacea]AOT12473.1 hypothetical protein S40542_06750 [Pseudoalteromonas luteoviolacea]AOT17387.1 hypothetical protein S4054_06750 [Pseudoalteromonas luteoviolacea]KKE81230.1 hypothetical protein N479_23220 [Pseudoalteromonas luteoviolacea S4054]KZN78538.1 hypothetical protein N481_26035 [Pseudoalteromonas luteoviolacea S4047-1]